jgi:hypothetical protein
MLTLCIIMILIAAVLFVCAGVAFSDYEIGGGVLLFLFAGVFTVISLLAIQQHGEDGIKGKVFNTDQIVESDKIYKLVGQLPISSKGSTLIVLDDGSGRTIVALNDCSVPAGAQYFKKGAAPERPVESRLVPVETPATSSTTPSVTSMGK